MKTLLLTKQHKRCGGSALRSSGLLAEFWDCACGWRNIPAWMDFCSHCWADRCSGDRQWAQLAEMDFRPGGQVASSSNRLTETLKEIGDGAGRSAYLPAARLARAVAEGGGK